MTTEKKTKKSRPDTIPRWLDDDGQLIVVAPKTKSGRPGRRQPKRLKLADFPDTPDGWRAWCTYQQARWAWLHENPKATTKAGRLQASIERTRAKLKEQLAKQKDLEGAEAAPPDALADEHVDAAGEAPAASPAQESGPKPKKRAVKDAPQA